VKTSDDDLLVFNFCFSDSAKARNLQDAGGRSASVQKQKRLHRSISFSESSADANSQRPPEAGPTMNAAALPQAGSQTAPLLRAEDCGENRVPFALAPKLSLPPLRNVRPQQLGPDIAIKLSARPLKK